MIKSLPDCLSPPYLIQPAHRERSARPLPSGLGWRMPWGIWPPKAQALYPREGDDWNLPAGLKGLARSRLEVELDGRPGRRAAASRRALLPYRALGSARRPGYRQDRHHVIADRRARIRHLVDGSLCGEVPVYSRSIRSEEHTSEL